MKLPLLLHDDAWRLLTVLLPADFVEVALRQSYDYKDGARGEDRLILVHGERWAAVASSCWFEDLVGYWGDDVEPQEPRAELSGHVRWLDDAGALDWWLQDGTLDNLPAALLPVLERFRRLPPGAPASAALVQPACPRCPLVLPEGDEAGVALVHGRAVRAPVGVTRHTLRLLMKAYPNRVKGCDLREADGSDDSLRDLVKERHPDHLVWRSGLLLPGPRSGTKATTRQDYGLNPSIPSIP
jgi:hypothetical protein